MIGIKRRTAVMPPPVQAAVHHRAGHYDGAIGSIGAARQLALDFLHQLAAEWYAPVGPERTQDILLVVSELATNAERHSGGPYLVELDGDAESVRVTVWDSGSTLPRVFAPDPLRVGGHGMEIVLRLCDSLTMELVPVGKRVRAHFDLTAPAAS
jgi:anti-sigma regulatory factor (Ser/Thr protein kinase)